ncbi:MAG: ABC transporter ATP-binding protein [Firmicutes bacterium]|nr:ABC transporter ATP-binding protein [Bacillota bacterium]
MTAIVELDGVGKDYAERFILSHVDFRLNAGEIIGLTGANGTGKSTLLRIMAGLSKPSEGRVWLFGQEPGPRSRSRIGVLLEAGFLYGDLTARETLLYYGRLYGIKRPADAANEWLERIELTRDGDELVKTFSKGMRQRLAMARAALHQPRLFLLDEPFDGLDQRQSERLARWVREWGEAGCGVVLISHDERMVASLSTRIVRMERGMLREVGKENRAP